jgi:hypothetical protein
VLSVAAVAAAAAATGSSPGFDPLTTWLIGQGTLGVIIIGMAYAIRKESARADSERARADRAEAAKDAMVDTFIDRVIPALTESTSATRELAEARRMRGHGA